VVDEPVQKDRHDDDAGHRHLVERSEAQQIKDIPQNLEQITATSVPMTPPRPPNKLVPPSTTAAIASSSRPWAAVGWGVGLPIDNQTLRFIGAFELLGTDR
jgi:hypothetical protein